MDKFEAFDEGDFWGVKINGEVIDNEECETFVKSLQDKSEILKSALESIKTAESKGQARRIAIQALGRLKGE